MLVFLKACLHALERGLAIGMLRSALCCHDGNTGGAMNQAHASFNFIAMLSARPTGDKELYLTVTFE
ncbi:MAG: hypothetical protein NVS3B14_06270 [Ktedonobacteraceae bacterium]